MKKEKEQKSKGAKEKTPFFFTLTPFSEPSTIEAWTKKAVKLNKGYKFADYYCIYFGGDDLMNSESSLCSWHRAESFS